MRERAFFVKFKDGISQLQYELTSSQKIYRDFKQMNIFEWLLLILMLEYFKYFLLYLLVEIQQLVHKISSFPNILYKKVFRRTSQNSQIKIRSIHPHEFCQKMFLKNFQNPGSIFK